MSQSLGTTTIANSTQYSFQRKIVRTNGGTLVLFANIDSYIKYKTSTDDGVNWSSWSSALYFDGYSMESFSIYIDTNDDILIAITSLINQKLWFKKLTYSSGDTWTENAYQQLWSGADFKGCSITRASNDYIWIVGIKTGADCVYGYSSNEGVDWLKNTLTVGDPTLSVSTIPKGTDIWMLVSRSNDLKLYIYSSSSWDGGTTISTDSNGDESLSVLKISDDNIWVACRGATTTGIVVFHYNGSWDGGTQISNHSNDTYPSLSNINSNPVLVWRDYDGSQYDIAYRKFDGSSWETQVNITNDNTIDIYPSVLELDDTDLYLTWTKGDSSPYDIYFDSIVIHVFSKLISETVNISDDIIINIPLENIIIDENTILSDEIYLSTDKTIELSETINLSEDVIINIPLENAIIDETLNLSDDIHVNINQENIELTETINLSEDVRATNGKYIFSTDLRTKISKVFKCLTNLITNIRTLKKYSTKLYTKAISSNKFLTDLRTRVSDYDAIQPGNLDDFIVKLDGIELTDVDYSTLRITYNQNSTPSNATFTLGRYHDKLDYKLNNVFSEITNENKIEVYDGTLKIFTGYITQINANSNTETVSITAEDCRYKMSKISMELWYGGTYNLEEGDYNTVYSKNVNVAILEVISEISSLISGYDTPTFGTLFVPEYNNSYNDCASLLTDLITNSANASWYIDANERLMFSKVGQGDIKTLQLSSVGNKRHVYDTIVDNVVLNKKIDSYCTSYNVKLGKHIIKTWNRTEFSGIVAYPWELKDKPEFTDFRFQKQYTNKKLYVGSGVTIVGVYVQDKGWIIEPFIVIQYLAKYSEDDLGDITVGSGEPKKTLDLTNYGKKEINVIWMEKTKKELNEMGYFKNAEWFKGSDDSQVYLTKIQGESYDYSIFAKDLANFNLSQNIKLITQSTVTLLLNAYKYNDIKLNNRINLSNTIESNIYNNNNGFPLNIDSISIDCATRIVTLNLTNYGKNWYEKTGNYINNYNPIVIESIQKKYSAMAAFNF